MPHGSYGVQYELQVNGAHVILLKTIWIFISSVLRLRVQGSVFLMMMMPVIVPQLNDTFWLQKNGKSKNTL